MRIDMPWHPQMHVVPLKHVVKRHRIRDSKAPLPRPSCSWDGVAIDWALGRHFDKKKLRSH